MSSLNSEFRSKVTSSPKRYKMDFIEKLTLSPFEKYTRFNRFPWKFFFHVLLILFTTYQALTIVSVQDKHSRIQEEVFSLIYLGTDDGSNSFPFYSLSQFQDHFSGIFNSTKSLDDRLLQYSRIDDLIYTLSIYYSEVQVKNQQVDYIEGTEEEFINNLPFDLQDLGDMKTFLNSIEQMNLQLKNLITYVSPTQDNSWGSCLNWTLEIEYSFQSFANIQSQLSATPNDCILDNKRVHISENIVFVNVVVFILATISLVLSWKQIYEISRQYMRFRNNPKYKGLDKFSQIDWGKEWDELGFFQKLKFFDAWFIISAGGNFFQFIGAVTAILNQVIDARLAIFQQKQTFIGFGAMFAWITILKYLQYNQSLNLMTSTLRKSGSNLIMFLIGVLPFFFGFVFLGQCIFWKYTKFEDTSASVITLFSLSNGDIVNDTFLETWAQGLPGQIYLILFLILFYTAVQNVFVTIIMEGYQQSLKQKQHQALLKERQHEQTIEFQKSLIESGEIRLFQKDQEQQRLNINEQSQQSSIVVSKIKLNSKRIDRVLQDMEHLLEQIQNSPLRKNQKQLILTIYKDNIDNISRNLKFQISNLGDR